jgi:hypothetical protein
MLPQVAVPGSDNRSQSVDVQIRYTTEHGALLRSDDRTRPATLDEIEAHFGEYVLNEMMENYGRWIDTAAPRGIVVTAQVNSRAYEIHIVFADEIAADFIVDADENLIVLPINATMFSVVQALRTAMQHEPPPRPILNRPVQLNPAAWPQPAA